MPSINQPLREGSMWDEIGIDRRTMVGLEAVICAWPAPTGHEMVPEVWKSDVDASSPELVILPATFLPPEVRARSETPPRSVAV